MEEIAEKLFRKLKRLIICKESILAMRRSPARRRRVRPALKQQTGKPNKTQAVAVENSAFDAQEGDEAAIERRKR